MHQYEWAANQMKLAAAVRHLQERSKIDPKIEINEESIKAEYIRRAGLVLNVEQVKEVKAKKAKKE